MMALAAILLALISPVCAYGDGLIDNPIVGSSLTYLDSEMGVTWTASALIPGTRAPECNFEDGVDFNHGEFDFNVAVTDTGF